MMDFALTNQHHKQNSQRPAKTAGDTADSITANDCKKIANFFRIFLLKMQKE